MTKQEKLGAMVVRAVELKRMIGDMEDELEDIKQALDESGLDRLDFGERSAVKVVQKADVLDNSKVRQLLGTKVLQCMKQQVKIFWKFG